MKSKKTVLIIEPYFGGSHKQFLQGLERWVDAKFIWLTLPARKWKMRMQLSAFWFVDEIKRQGLVTKNIDVVLCSTFVDVSVLKAQLCMIPGWKSDIPIHLYFHENQFVYPNQPPGHINFQFTTINFTSAMASNKIAFNSQFNKKSFLSGCRRLLKKTADMKLISLCDQLEEKSTVIYPGIDFDLVDEVHGEVGSTVSITPTLVWNHRWEHDKGPDLFFDTLLQLKNKGVLFKLIILGQSFVNKPECFQEAEKVFQDELIQFGFAETYEDYVKYLKIGDIVISTASHEFFGISILEAVRAGNYPLLPNELSYPELFPNECLYERKEFVDKLIYLIEQKVTWKKLQSFEMTDRYNWKNLKSEYENWLLY